MNLLVLAPRIWLFGFLLAGFRFFRGYYSFIVRRVFLLFNKLNIVLSTKFVSNEMKHDVLGLLVMQPVASKAATSQVFTELPRTVDLATSAHFHVSVETFTTTVCYLASPSPAYAALDYRNLFGAHYICTTFVRGGPLTDVVILASRRPDESWSRGQFVRKCSVINNNVNNNKLCSFPLLERFPRAGKY
jgi:hypothetical protein